MPCLLQCLPWPEAISCSNNPQKHPGQDRSPLCRGLAVVLTHGPTLSGISDELGAICKSAGEPGLVLGLYRSWQFTQHRLGLGSCGSILSQAFSLFSVGSLSFYRVCPTSVKEERSHVRPWWHTSECFELKAKVCCEMPSLSKPQLESCQGEKKHFECASNSLLCALLFSPISLRDLGAD